jgi:hypothetical protein
MDAAMKIHKDWWDVATIFLALLVTGLCFIAAAVCMAHDQMARAGLLIALGLVIAMYGLIFSVRKYRGYK